MSETESKISVPDQAILTASLLNNVGMEVAAEGGDALHAGIAMLRRAIALNPLDMGHRLNLANYLTQLGEEDEAAELATFVLKHNDRAAIGWQIMGLVNTNRGLLDDAIACARRAHECDPGNGQLKFDLAAAYLRAGDFGNGLPLYEFRNQILPSTGDVPNAPTWRGEKTGHLIIWPDQGHGDLMMFARFVPWAKERADKVTFLVNPLVLSLFVGYGAIPGVEVNYVYDPKAKFDHQIRVSSLPLVYGLTPGNIPPDPGLLSGAKSEGRLPGDGLRIGIAWQGNPRFPGDRLRSIPFREFLPLCNDPRNTIYSLQCGPAAADISKARARRIVGDLSGQIEGEWSHTAAAIKSLDLVVSSCTGIAHLAGALGVPSFVMIGKFAYWAWLHGREDTPWYPHTRLFRQTRVGDWGGVMQRVLAAVEDLHQRRALFGLLGKHKPGALIPLVDPNLPGTADHKEPDVASALRKVLRPGDTFVDVGANVGMHTLLAAELVGAAGKVLAFEPGENALPELRQAVEQNDYTGRVEIVPQPLWCKAKDLTFHLCADGSGGNATWDPGKFPCNDKTRANPQRRKLRATTLDIECGKRRLAPRLIKIDTEGAEQRVLEGAAALLFEHKPPFIIAEFHEFGLHELGCSLASLRAFMAKAGYATFQLFADGSRPWRVPDDRQLVCPADFIINLLFSTEELVNGVWTQAPTSADRLIYGYKMIEKPAESAA